MLTHDEELEGIVWAKQQKDARLKYAEMIERQEANRKALTGTRWPYEQTMDFIKHRAGSIFKGRFSFDDKNLLLIETLCYYFSDDPKFELNAESMGVKNPSRQKGILLAGNYGTGKTWILQLFQRNQRQVYHMRSSIYIANAFESDGQSAIETFSSPVKNPVNDRDSFFHTHAGLCIDDLGTEDIKTHFGNKKNVIGDIIEMRYHAGFTGVMLHGSTNLTADQLKDYYGARVISRFREIFNFFELTGGDRRK